MAHSHSPALILKTIFFPYGSIRASQKMEIWMAPKTIPFMEHVHFKPADSRNLQHQASITNLKIIQLHPFHIPA
jgi:hypothetical protein